MYHKFLRAPVEYLNFAQLLYQFGHFLRNEVAVDSQLTNSNVSRRNTFSSYLLAVSLLENKIYVSPQKPPGSCSDLSDPLNKLDLHSWRKSYAFQCLVFRHQQKTSHKYIGLRCQLVKSRFAKTKPRASTHQK